MWVLGAWEKPLLCPLLLSVPIPTLDGIAELSSGVLMTTPCPPPPVFPFGSVSLLSQVVSPNPSASSLHVAEGPGLPQVLCLSNKVELKPGYWAALSVWPRGWAWWLTHGGQN